MKLLCLILGGLSFMLSACGTFQWGMFRENYTGAVLICALGKCWAVW